MYQDLTVISGTYRSRKLLSPKGSTHPMGAREKNALMNRLNVAGLTILDAYAGSGALGIEALSRGAESVDFVEKSPTATNIIKANLMSLGVLADVYTESIENYISSADKRYDIIIADPPYDDFRPEVIMRLVKLLKPGGTLALSSPADLPAPEFPPLTLAKTNTYAGARITTYNA